MKIDAIQVRSYFAPPAKSYWQWRDSCSVAAWHDGLTITFYDELERVLTCLAPQGLPPLGSVLLLIAASRDNWEEPPNRRTLLQAQLGLLYGAHYSDLLAEVLTGMGKIHGVRNRLREQPAWLGQLAVTLFCDAPGRYSPDDSLALLTRFRDGLVEEEMAWKASSALDDLLHDLGCLRWGLRHFDPDRLEFQLRTGLDDAPQPAPVEPPPLESARSLIRSLADDPELGGVARLAQLLLAAVQLPRALSDPDELPVGGLSDIANRGPLDRLLISELANDDLALSVRVAMKEALYLRRESPPRSPPRARRVLLDAGLRTWGVPRVFITAVGLALAAKSDPRHEVQVFRAEGKRAVPVDLNSLAGLEQHLSALDHRLHPGEALSSDELAAEDADTVLVTTGDTLADHDFQRHLQARSSPMYLATVARDGSFRLLARSPRGSKVTSQARFDLDEILRPRPRTPKLLMPARDERLPAIFAQERLPLRLSCPVEVSRSWFVHPHTVISFTRDGRLMLWDSPQHGARQIADGAPAGSLLWCSSAWDDDTIRLVIGKKTQHGLRSVTYNRHTGKVHVTKLALSGSQPISVWGRGTHAFVTYAQSLDVVSLVTGELLAATAMPKGTVVGSPGFLRKESGNGGLGEWQAITYCPGAVGSMVVGQRVWREMTGHKLIALFHRVGSEGPVAITELGEVFEPPSGDYLQPDKTGLSWRLKNLPPRPLFLDRVSRDGLRAVVVSFPGAGAAPAVSLLMDTRTAKLSENTRSGDADLEQPMFALARPRNLRNRFTAIGLTDQRQLALLSRRGQWWPITCAVGVGGFHLDKAPLQPTRLARAFRCQGHFSALEGFDRGYSLELAQFGGRCRAWLDSRGLLHLASSDRTVPDCSLILTEGPLAGWLSDGRVFGPPYWHDGQQPTPVQEILRDFWEPFLANLR